MCFNCHGCWAVLADTQNYGDSHKVETALSYHKTGVTVEDDVCGFDTCPSSCPPEGCAALVGLVRLAPTLTLSQPEGGKEGDNLSF